MAIPRPTKPKADAKPRTKPAEVRREELLDAAEHLFLEQGLAATSVDEIVTRAQVAKGTFYLHFASKDALVIGLQERFMVRLQNAIEKALARKRADDHRGRLRAWIQAGAEGFLEQYALHEIVFHEFRPEDHKPDRDNVFFVSFIELLQAGTAAGAFDLSDPELSGMMLLHAFHGAGEAMQAANTSVARKHLTKQLETFALRVVGVP
ncbi:MAG TPA: TetR/AcrR family transcriptional regulator [Polyangiales bacterium]|nr:TetR/AcrR family transcriptional regulator [Polyangiales bacterium]